MFFLFGLALASLSAEAQVFYVNSNLPPILQADAGSDNSLVKGDSLQIGGDATGLYGYGNYSYFWSPETGLNEPTSPNPWVKPDKTTTYILTVSDGHHCLAMDEVTIKVNASGLNDLSNPLKVTIYPNPSSQYVNINILGTSGPVTVKIHNSLGQILLHKETVIQEYHQFSFDIRSWKKGLYYVIIQSDHSIHSQALVIL